MNSNATAETLWQADSFLVRSPLLPKDQFIHIGRVDLPTDLDTTAMCSWLVTERIRIRNLLRELICKPPVQEAISVASPSVARAITVWLDTPTSPSGQRAEHSLIRYVARMSTRCTPFGLFSGCTVGKVSNHSRVQFEGQTKYVRHTRIDSDYLLTMIEQIAKDADLRKELHYYTNNSGYVRAGQLRYAERTQIAGMRQYQLNAVDSHSVLLEILEIARGGARLADLSRHLQIAADVSPKEAWEFLEELIDNQILESELLPTMTGPEPLGTLIQALIKTEAGAHLTPRLTELVTTMEQLDVTPVGDGQPSYEHLMEALRDLPLAISKEHLIQTDMYKPASEASLDRDVVSRVENALRVIYSVSGRNGKGTELEKFIKSFRERYDDQLVPLVDALDAEAGIAFGVSSAEPLVMGLGFGLDQEPRERKADTPYDQFLLRRLFEFQAQGHRVWHLTEEDVQIMKRPGPNHSPSLAGLVSLLEPREANSPRILLKWVHNASPVKLLGRFAHLHSDIRAMAKSLISREVRLHPTAVLAEIVHLPEGRLGNISLRPCLREYEIECLGRSGAAPDRIITMDDLYIGFKDGLLLLWSKRLGREVIPKLSNAHNWAAPTNNSLYRFLCSLEEQGLEAEYNWSWGSLRTAPFLPRVEYAGVILSKARWNLGTRDLEPLRRAKGDGIWHSVQALRTRLGLPRFVMLVEGDMELLVDLHNILSVESLVALISKRDFIVLSEAPEVDSSPAVSGPEGAFCHEILIPFLSHQTNDADDQNAQGMERLHLYTPETYLKPIGSDWVYVVLYTGISTTDRLLTDVLGPLVSAWLEAGEIQDWFFVRSTDPSHQLRIRFRTAPGKSVTTIIERMGSIVTRWVERGMVWKVQIDTYRREVERYGGPEGLACCEAWFGEDSQFVVTALQLIPSEQRSQVRWHLALYCVDLLLEVFGLSNGERLRQVSEWRDGLGKEFNASKELWSRIGDMYRVRRREFGGYLGLPGVPSAEWEPSLQIALEHWRIGVHELSRQLFDLEQQGRLTLQVRQLLFSLAHMHVNRLLRADQRAQEVVLYDFLRRVYLARNYQPSDSAQ